MYHQRFQFVKTKEKKHEFASVSTAKRLSPVLRHNRTDAFWAFFQKRCVGFDVTLTPEIALPVIFTSVQFSPWFATRFPLTALLFTGDLRSVVAKEPRISTDFTFRRRQTVAGILVAARRRNSYLAAPIIGSTMQRLSTMAHGQE